MPSSLEKDSFLKREQIKVSVIIPTYNEEKNIGKCLENLRKQTFPKIEVIVVNDGSSDKTREIVRIFKEVRLINFFTNKGKTHALDEGVKRSKGQFLLFLDADVELLPKAIEILISYRRNIMGRCFYMGRSFIGEKFKFYAQKGVGEACFFLNREWFLRKVGREKIEEKNDEVRERLRNISFWNKMEKPLLTNEVIGFVKVPNSIWFGLKSAFRSSKRDICLFLKGFKYPLDIHESAPKNLIKSLFFPFLFPLLPFYFAKEGIKFWKFTNKVTYGLFLPFYLTAQFGATF